MSEAHNLTAISQNRGTRNDTIQCDRHELRRLLGPGRKGGEQGPGRHVLLGEPVDELDGRGGRRRAAGHHRRRAGGGLRRVLKGRGQSRAERCRGGGRAGGSRNAEAEAPAALVARLPARADVFLEWDR